MDIKQLRSAFFLLLLLTLLTGLIYPLVITGVAQLLFPWQANGSLLKQDNKIIGSKWIGQSFASADFFHGRPSATVPFPYNAKNSAGSNIGLTNPALKIAIQANIDHLHLLDPNNNQMIPIDLVTHSASGLDPDISPESAYYQTARIAKARNISSRTLIQIIEQQTIRPLAGFIGESKVNVLNLNLALLAITNQQSTPTGSSL